MEGKLHINYSDLGTSNKRKEKEEDHARLKEIMDAQWDYILNFSKRSKDEIREWQLRRIKELVSHAFQTVPLYTDKYSKEGFEPGDLKQWEDFEKLPLLRKNELIDAFPDRFISSEHDLEFTTRSSGSSGRFVTIAVSPQAVYLDTLQGARQLIMQSSGRYSKNDTALFINTGPWWVGSINGDYPSEFLPTTSLPSKAIKLMKSIKPRALSTYPTYLSKLASKGFDPSECGVGLIIVHSEQSSAKRRAHLSSTLGIPVLDEFSSEELTRIALECPHNKYHLEEDACYTEILDQKTLERSKEGDIGLVVGTNLLNEATPIIRYCQDDLARKRESRTCGCGSNFRVVGSPEGRVMDSIILPRGSSIPASCFMDLAYNWYLQLDVPVHGLKYQVVQREKNEIEIFLIPRWINVSPSQKERIRKSLYQLVSEDVNVKVSVVHKPPYNQSAKYRPVLSLIKK